jgi:hypothetical protein
MSRPNFIESPASSAVRIETPSSFTKCRLSIIGDWPFLRLLLLLEQHLIGITRIPGEEHQEMLLEILKGRRGNPERLDPHALAGEVEAREPPCAAMYWSCLPTARLSSSISIRHASSADGLGRDMLEAKAWSARSSPTVNAPDEPRPVPDGDVGHADHLDPGPDRMRLQRLADDRVLDLVHRPHALQGRVLEEVVVGERSG